jgi:hypothetical protein
MLFVLGTANDAPADDWLPLRAGLAGSGPENADVIEFWRGSTGVREGARGVIGVILGVEWLE